MLYILNNFLDLTIRRLVMLKFSFYFLIIAFQCFNSAFSSSSYEDFCDTRNSQVLVDQVHQKIGYKFQDISLLYDVFTHHSSDPKSRFRKLEFLGDKVINAVVGISTFNISKDVGSLDGSVQAKVNNKYLAQQFKRLGLDYHVRANPSCDRETIAADAFEALVGAMQLDFGVDDQISPAASKLIVSMLDIRPLRSSQVISRYRTSQEEDVSFLMPDRRNGRKNSNDSGNAEAALLAGAVVGVGTALAANGLFDFLGSLFGSDKKPDYHKLYRFHEQQHYCYKNAFLGLCCLTGTMGVYSQMGAGTLGQLLYWGCYAEAAYVTYYICRAVGLLE